MKIVVDGVAALLQSPHTASIFWQYANRNGIEVTQSTSQAKCIYADVGVSTIDLSRINTSLFSRFGRKYVWGTSSDNPDAAYSAAQTGVKIIAQPLYGPEINRRNRIVVSPLTMDNVEWEIVKNRDSLLRWREQRRKHTFIFQGNLRPRRYRRFLTRLTLPEFELEHRRPFWHRSTEAKIRRTRAFLDSLAASRYAFAPRGAGTSSFRLYQAMSVGTVPIVSGMCDYPYREEVDWNKFAIVADDHRIDVERLLDEAHWQQMSQAASDFWDEYVYLPRLCDKLTSKVASLLETCGSCSSVRTDDVCDEK